MQTMEEVRETIWKIATHIKCGEFGEAIKISIDVSYIMRYKDDDKNKECSAGFYLFRSINDEETCLEYLEHLFKTYGTDFLYIDTETGSTIQKSIWDCRENNNRFINEPQIRIELMKLIKKYDKHSLHYVNRFGRMPFNQWFFEFRGKESDKIFPIDE
jgi:hypothetical protein